MFDATYLGHQGWLLESASTRVLIDPVLGRRLTGTLGDPIEIYPPRELDIKDFPPLDAVIVSHEHPDHLNVPTLLRLDRSIPVLIPSRASTAARDLLAELGFEARLLRSGQTMTIGSLEIHPFHTREITRDEWDVTPLVVRDRAGEGSLATSIDAPESRAFAEFAVERAGRVGLWASSHNAIDLFFTEEGGRQEPNEAVTARLAREYLERLEEQFPSGPRPDTLVVLGTGFAFTGDLAWMNRHAFPGRADAVAHLIARKLRGVRVRSPVPGNRFSLSGGRLVDEVWSRPFFSTKDPADWPPHAAEPLEGAPPDYAPASGRDTLEPEELDALAAELRGFAGHLYGSELMRSLYATPEASVAFRVRQGGARVAFGYRPEACSFERLPDGAPRATAGFECWASDLLAVLRHELLAGYVTLGRCRAWNQRPDHLHCDLAGELSLYTHPLRNPARMLEYYRRTARELEASLGPERIARARS